jgi:predicted AlkP superfamily pyrophosphatase or phosphodiesterase
MRKALALLVLLSALPAFAKPPRLTLVITVDALSTDLLLRMKPKLKGGLAQLLSQGAFFPDARYEYAEVHTAAGHATLATGANPWRHGIVANRAVDRATGKLVATLGDPNHPVLEVPLSEVQDASPDQLMAETVADRLKLSTYGQAKVVSVSLKARAAITVGGRLGQAWWFSEAVGKFVTGTYYAKEFPTWVKTFNDRKPAHAAFDKSWGLALPAREYGGEDDRPFETDFHAMGRTFPHPLNGGLPSPGPNSHYALAGSPFGADMLVQFARDAIEAEQLGRDDVPDLLAVSFSNTDHIYHAYGPYSWEMQDTMVRLDKTIGDLVAAAERVVGKGNLLVVLSADHGGAAIPEEWAALGLPAARILEANFGKDLSSALQAQFGAPVLAGLEEGGIYLSDRVIAERKLDGAAVRRAVVAYLAKLPYVAYAVARDDLQDPANLSSYAKAVRLGYYPGRSGDVQFVLRPYHILDTGPTGAIHATPYSYDNQVPVIFQGKGVKPGFHPQRIGTVDVAATLSALLEIGTPAQTEGSARPEVFGNGR